MRWNLEAAMEASERSIDCSTSMSTHSGSVTASNLQKTTARSTRPRSILARERERDDRSLGLSFCLGKDGGIGHRLHLPCSIDLYLCHLDNGGLGITQS